MPTTDGREENASRVLADCTISGDRGMLVFQAAEPDKIPVSAEQGIRFVTMRLCAIVGVAMLITAGLLWFSGMRQSANFSAQSDETPMQVADGGQEVRSAENDLAATSGKPVATAAPILPTPVVAPTGGTRTPMQVANGDGEVEVQPATRVEPPVAENDLAATIGKPVPTASSSLPTPVVAAAGGTAKLTSESTLAPVGSSAVPQPALASGSAMQLDKTEIAMLVSRGKDFVRDGDLASARLLFQRAAAAGNAEAAFSLGTTFDPLFIRRMGVVGMEPDVARAREWYERAAELGSADASQQLATLQRR